jgi:hypothetical protein
MFWRLGWEIPILAVFEVKTFYNAFNLCALMIWYILSSENQILSYKIHICELDFNQSAAAINNPHLWAVASTPPHMTLSILTPWHQARFQVKNVGKWHNPPTIDPVHLVLQVYAMVYESCSALIRPCSPKWCCIASTDRRNIRSATHERKLATVHFFSIVR